MRPAHVILSCNSDPKYMEFWPLVSKAWKKLFDIEPWLVIVVPDVNNVPFGMYEKNTLIFPTVSGIPECNQAKVARYYVAAAWNDDSVVMTHDIDLLPLQTAYADSLFKQRPAGHLLTIGSELYTGHEHGKFSAGYLTAESCVWHKLMNPNSLSWSDFVQSFVGMSVFDHKEDISRTVYHEDPDTFSDESLLRALLSRNPTPVIRLPFGYWPYTTRALDRSNWQFDFEKLKNGTYVEAHMLRPWSLHKAELKPLVDWIENV